jgi:lambda family phage portal protein
LRDLARDLGRNNGWTVNGVDIICNNTVNSGITPSPVPGTGVRRAKAAQEAWDSWATNPAECDVEGRETFYALQYQVMRTVVVSGECLIMRRWTPGQGALGMRIQVLEPDYIDHYRDGIVTKDASGKIVSQTVQGVEFDGDGRRQAYWIYKEHPGAMRQVQGYTSERVSADDVIHVLMADRPGQARGVTWLAPVIVALETLAEYEDATLMKAKVSACFSIFVTDDMGTSSPIGEVNSADTVETLEPGMVHYLRQGQKVDFASPPGENGYDAFTKAQLRRVAAGLGVTYEDLTGDFGNSSFSAMRLSRLRHWQKIYGYQWHMLIPQFCDRVWQWVQQAAIIANLLDAPCAAQWSTVPMPLIEPDKEGKAYSLLVRNGVKTLPEVVREQGKNWDQHLAEIKASNDALDAAGIWLDSDPRRTSIAGLTQERGSSGSAVGTKAAVEQAALGGDGQ